MSEDSKSIVQLYRAVDAGNTKTWAGLTTADGDLVGPPRGGGSPRLYQQPEQHGKQKSAQCPELQQEGMWRNEVADHAVGQEKDSHRNGSQDHQADIDKAMQTLP